jgi:hypothetical protein
VTDVIPTSSDEWSDQQEELRRAKEAIVGPVPLISPAPDCRVELPRGLFAREGWQRQAVVRELTGEDEEALAKVRDAGEYFDLVITQGVVRLGALDLEALPLDERQGFLQRLLVGEREQLFLGVIKATYGAKKTLEMTCQFCQQKQDLRLDLDEDFKPLPVKHVEDESFAYVTSRGERLTVRTATGADQQEVLSRKGASNAEQNTILLARCIIDCEGEVIVDPIDFARAMSMRDRRALLDEMLARQPRVDLTVTVNCVSCKEAQTVELGWMDLFRP